MKEITVLMVVGLGLLSARCGDEEAMERGKAPVYETRGEVLEMPKFAGEIVWASPCSVKLRSEAGDEVMIGSPATTDALGGFVVGRKNGERMELPGDFAEYLKAGQ